MDQYTTNVRIFFNSYREIGRRQIMLGYRAEQEKELLQKRLCKQFECSICYSCIKPPISICDNGHVICCSCWVKCNKCPYCRIPKLNSPTPALNNLYKLIKFQCDYEGCSLIAPGNVMNTHQNVCGHYRLKCPLQENFNCNWEGKWNKIHEHLHKGHNANVYFNDSVMIQLDVVRLGDKYRFILVCNNNIFMLDYEIDKRVPIAQFNVNPVRPSSKKYRYQLEFTASNFLITSCLSSATNTNIGRIRIPIKNIMDVSSGKIQFKYQMLRF